MDSPQPPVLPETVIGGLTPGEIRAVTHERLRLLSWGYFIAGGMGILISSFLLIYVVLLGALSMIPASEWESSSSRPHQQVDHVIGNNPPSEEENSGDRFPSTAQNPPPSGAPPVWIFRIFAGMMFVFVLIGWTISGLTIYAGRCIRQRRNRMLILVMAGFNLMSVPFGTLLGICTFLVLQSDPGRREFGLA